jgi:threonine dehydratase
VIDRVTPGSECDPDYGPVICGQGTIGAEFLEQVPDLDVVVVPISGGAGAALRLSLERVMIG